MAWEMVLYPLDVAVLVLSLSIWSRGIRKSRVSDLLAGPAILIVFCIVWFIIDSHDAPAVAAILCTFFGSITLLLGGSAPPDGVLKKPVIHRIGAAALLLAFALSMFICL